jgi:hypothetical protein
MLISDLNGTDNTFVVIQPGYVLTSGCRFDLSSGATE